MGRRYNEPSKTIGFKLVTDEVDKNGKVRNVNPLDIEVYEILCSLPVSANITQFVKTSIVEYSKLLHGEYGKYPPKTECPDHIVQEFVQELNLCKSRLDKIESEIIETSQKQNDTYGAGRKHDGNYIKGKKKSKIGTVNVPKKNIPDLHPETQENPPEPAQELKSSKESIQESENTENDRTEEIAEEWLKQIGM